MRYISVRGFLYLPLAFFPPRLVSKITARLNRRKRRESSHRLLLVLLILNLLLYVVKMLHVWKICWREGSICTLWWLNVSSSGISIKKSVCKIRVLIIVHHFHQVLFKSHRRSGRTIGFQCIGERDSVVVGIYECCIV